MNIVAAFKVVPDDQDIQVSADGTLDYSKAKNTVSAYDLNAIEAAAQLAAANEGSNVVAVTVGGADIDDSKLKKNVLARGVDELYMTADDACKGLDARGTAAALAELVSKVGGFDVVLCGDGSADNYAQQVDVQLADALDLPVVTAVSAVSVEGAVATCDRMLETQLQTVQVDLPAVISVVPDIALPRIPGMKDILAAGKKPMNVAGADGAYESSIEVASCLAPKQADRKREILEASADGAIEQFAAALKAAL
ncbi:MAG: putative electron transfer flavoprotein FixA [Eggerthella lenta]